MTSNPNHNFKNNVNFQHQYLSSITGILRQYAHLMVNVRLATPDEDTKQSTDMVIEMDNKATIAVRIRRSSSRFRDFTIRAQAKHGGKTELAKLREGWADWYIYAWENDSHAINEFVLINLPQLRKANGLSDYHLSPFKSNGDGTGFRSLTIQQLKRFNALIAGRVLISGYWETYQRETAIVPFALPEHLKKAG